MSPFALIHHPGTGRWLRLEDPAWVLATTKLAEVGILLTEGFARDTTGATLCCLSYEASPAFDASLSIQSPGTEPLLWMAGFQRLTEVAETAALALAESPPCADCSEVLFGPWRPEMSPADYARAFRQVKEHLAEGNAYQINLTQRYRAELLQTPSRAALLRLFVRLAPRFGGPHAAFVDTGDLALLSFSPETFFEQDGKLIRCRPMKGTAARGATTEQDRRAALALRASDKERAENRMIVDMVRNDLGRVAQPGSVAVPALFDVRSYPGVHQMISEVRAETGATREQLLGALFPSASVTGAPKVAAMSIIAALEASPRGFYTGTIGALLADGRSFWNVAIRTLSVQRSAARAEYGSGGGIVWDSRMESELSELQLKARVLADTKARFGLVETMLLQADGDLFLLDRHLARLERSAAVFDFCFDSAAIRVQLEAAIDAARGQEPGARILRLVVNNSEGISVSIQTFNAHPMPLRVRIAARPVNSQQLLLRHKTTDRSHYLAAAGTLPSGGEEVFLVNERGELTEGTFTNIVLELDGRWVTPPISAGLLPGCYRAQLLAEGRVAERSLAPADLERATAIWAINSVRGMMKSVLA